MAESTETRAHIGAALASFAESSEKNAYFRGTQDGALALLADALGCEPDGIAHQLMGERVTVSVEWPDGAPEDAFLRVAREMAAKARERVRRG